VVGKPRTPDALLGRAVERMVTSHHRRRLRRVGWLHALDVPADPEGAWFSDGAVPPRDGCELQVHVDGSQVLPRLVAAIEAARSHVHITSWILTPNMLLPDANGAAGTLRELLARRAADGIEVRVLHWAGVPAPGSPISRTTVRRLLHELADGTDVRWRMDARERPMHCHHEKVVLVDDQVAFVGGMDLTIEHGDRRDTPAHPERDDVGWHDISCELRGPVVADVARHFAMRWSESPRGDGDPGPDVPLPEPVEPAEPPTPGPSRVQLVRTVPEHVYDSLPDGSFTVLETYLRALRGARELIYLENQFLWSPEIVDVLMAKLRNPPSEQFRIALVLPSAPELGGDDTRGQLACLLEADGGRGRIAACCLAARPVPNSPPRMPSPVYVHAKLGIVDDRWMSIGSANLNEHSLFNDSEANVVTDDPELVRDTRLRLWEEHTLVPRAQLEQRAPADVIDELFLARGLEQRRLVEAGTPPEHHLIALAGVSKRSMRLFGPLQSLLVDG
jgi:phosphatidylserine/phosphatidylglycerophosphate/cardiolipin synthase-like enzyme